MLFHPPASPHQASVYEKKSHKSKRSIYLDAHFPPFQLPFIQRMLLLFYKVIHSQYNIHTHTHTSSLKPSEKKASREEKKKIKKIFNLIFRSFLLSFHNKMGACDKITIYHSFNVNSTSRCHLCCCVLSSTLL